MARTRLPYRRSGGARRSQAGSIIPLLVICAVPLLLVLALAVDSFIMVASEEEQENNAEYANIAMLDRFLDLGDSVPIADRKQQSVTRAEQIAGMNFYLGARGRLQVPTGGLGTATTGGENGTATFGVYDATAETFTPDPADAGTINASRLELKTTPTTALSLMFGRLTGVSSKSIMARSLVYYDPARRAGGQNAYVVIE